ncbi:chemotaxis protein histidine kinase CheA [Embleya sp. AB8]
MVASSVQELRVSLEQEAAELAGRRDRLQGELADVERQLAARLSAVEHLALIRPLTSEPASSAEPEAPAEAAPAAPAVESEATASAEPAIAEIAEPAAPETPVATVPAPRRSRKAVAAVAAVTEQPRIQADSARKAAPAKPATKKKAARAKAGPAGKPATAKASSTKAGTTKSGTTKAAGTKASTVVTATEAAPAPAAARPVRSHLRDEIAALLAGTGEPMNVRQLTEALGETATKSRMESVRTSTEGLVKAGRAVKTGRGLFTGPAA